MTAKKLARTASAALVLAAMSLAPSEIAHADNSNENSNTNTNSDAGGYLNAGGGSDDSKGWPPTKADWPPSDMSVGGLSEDTGGAKSGKPAPIVMPDGQSAPATSAPTTSTTPTPIVPVSGGQ